MANETFRYYITFSYVHFEHGLRNGCREVELKDRIEAPGERLKLAASIAVQFPNAVILDWKRID